MLYRNGCKWKCRKEKKGESDDKALILDERPRFMDFGLFSVHQNSLTQIQTRKFSPLIDPKICYIQLRFPEYDFPSLVKQIYCVKTQNMHQEIEDA